MESLHGIPLAGMRAVHRLQGAAFFDPADYCQQLRCREFGNRLRSDLGKDSAFQLAADPVGMTLGPVRRVRAIPGPQPRNCLDPTGI